MLFEKSVDHCNYGLDREVSALAALVMVMLCIFSGKDFSNHKVHV